MTDLLERPALLSDRDPGRIPHLPEENRGWTVRELLDERSKAEATIAEARREEKLKYWPCGPTLNQRREGQCVSEAVHDARNSSPIRIRPPEVDYADRNDFYHRCQHRDPWTGCHKGPTCPIEPSSQKYGGTAVHTGMVLGREAGWWGEFRWIGAGSGRLEDDLIQTLRTVGPIIFGIPWLDGMYETNPDGLVDVSGPEVGGHAIRGWEWMPRLRLPRSFKGTKPAVALHNSWGPEKGELKGWGITRRRTTGVGFILLDDLMPLLENRRGEGAVPLRKAA